MGVAVAVFSIVDVAVGLITAVLVGMGVEELITFGDVVFVISSVSKTPLSSSTDLLVSKTDSRDDESGSEFEAQAVTNEEIRAIKINLRRIRMIYQIENRTR